MVDSVACAWLHVRYETIDNTQTKIGVMSSSARMSEAICAQETEKIPEGKAPSPSKSGWKHTKIKNPYLKALENTNDKDAYSTFKQ